MIYVDINKKRFLLGLTWNEIPLKQGESQKDLNNRVKGSLSKGHNFGLVSKSMVGDVISVGEFNVRYTGIWLPAIHSLGYATAKKIQNGVYVASFSLSDLSSNIKKEIRLSPPQFIEEMDLNDRFYWVCACQDGVVVSSGEFVGLAEDAKGFIADFIGFLNEPKVYASTSDCPVAKSTGLTPNIISIESIISVCKKDCLIRQINGIDRKKATVSLSFLVLLSILGVQYQGYIAEQKAALERLKAEKLTITKSPEEIAREQLEAKKITYMNRFAQEGVNVTSSLNYKKTRQVIREKLTNTPFGWHLDSVNCFSTGVCSFRYVNQDSFSTVADFLLKTGKQLNEVGFSADGKSITIGERVPVEAKSFEVNEANLNVFFKELPGLENNLELISISQANNGRLGGRFKWVVTQEKEHKTDVSAFPNAPSSVFDMALTISASDFYEMDSIFLSYQKNKKLNLSQVEIKNSADNKITWALKYSYKSTISNK